METINLRVHYPEIYAHDQFIEVSDEVAATFATTARQEAAHDRRVYWHGAHYSLDRGDGIEYDALKKPLPLWAAMENKQTRAELHDALAWLPDKQRRRVYAHYFLGMSKTEIARREGVHKSRVTRSIADALRNLETLVRYPF